MVGLLCLLIGGAGLLLAWRAADASQAVLVTTRDVAIGQQLSADDVTRVNMRLGPGIAALPSDQPVDGQVALVDLPGGTLLVAGAVGQLEQVPDRTVRVAVVVTAGLAPIGVLGVGTPVTLCGASGDMIAGTVASAPASVPDTSRYRFDVRVALDDAITLAQWVADGSLVVTSP